MNESILETVRSLCGLDPENDEFDNELIPITNSVFATLSHLGVGPKKGYCISGVADLWKDYLTTDKTLLGLVRQYVPMKTRLIFDPPSSSAVLTSYEKTASELEWRIVERNEGR